jgi:hypothetical protein
MPSVWQIYIKSVVMMKNMSINSTVATVKTSLFYYTEETFSNIKPVIVALKKFMTIWSINMNFSACYNFGAFVQNNLTL